MWLVTDVADDTFLVPEGLLHPDTLLAGAYEKGNAPAQHVAYDTDSWSANTRLEQPGRASACGRHVVVLRPAGASPEPRWQAVLLDTAAGARLELGAYAGHDVRVLWDSACRSVAIAQESEQEGLRTVVARRTH